METSAESALVRYAAAFRRADLPFMIVGAFAVMAHGMPRTSADLDIVVHLPFSDRSRVSAVLEGIGAHGPEERKDEFGQRIVVEDEPSGLQIEVFFTPPREPYASEYSRRTNVDVSGEQIPFISPEDLVLRRLVNTRLRRGLDYDDAVGVLVVQGSTFDLGALRGRCALYRVCDLLERAVEDARRSS